MRYLIGIDDTDNAESRGTGYRARTLGDALAADGLAAVQGITRHQLLVAPGIPYTSHNSSACLLVDLSVDVATVASCCRDFLLRECAPGSDAGLCITAWDAVRPTVEAFGSRAKREILTAAEALVLAQTEGLLLEGLTGDHGGVIGALAAVGLRASGEDGRFIWLRGIREVSGIHRAEALYQLTGIQEIRTLDGAPVPATADVDLGTWFRPVLSQGQAVLLVENMASESGYYWCVAAKEAIKARSN